MWSIVGVITVTMIIYLIEYPKLKKSPNQKDKWTFLILLTTGILLSILKINKVNLFNPIKVIEYMYKPVYENVFNWLL